MTTTTTILDRLARHGEAETSAIHRALVAEPWGELTSPVARELIALKRQGFVGEFSSWGVSYWHITPAGRAAAGHK